MKRWIRVSAVCLTSVLFAAPALAQVDARMFRYPDISESQIAFVYAGDIWVVDKAGGTAKRLSSPVGEEQFPRFSPDGSRIAFSGNYDGNTDVYVLPASGGEPLRITYHPAADRLVGWHPDGDRLLIASGRASGSRRFNQLYLVSAEGGLATKLPLAYGEFGAFSPDGRQLAFTTKNRGFRTWKRYRGGWAPEVWLFDLKTLDARNVSQSDANDSQPMWHGDTLYFLSDRGPAQRANIWAFDTGSGDMRQVTRFTDFDITFPAIGPSDMVFQAGGRLYVLSLANEKYAEVAVEVVTDLSTLRPRQVNAGDLIQASAISPSGKRAVFQARGEIFTVPAEHGVILNLSQSPGAAERYPAWSPDGNQIAFWSDRTGEYELTVQPADGSGEQKTLTKLGPGYRYQPYWSPDSSKIAFINQDEAIQVYDLKSDKLTKVDTGRLLLHPGLENFHASWSADSRWLTYSKNLETFNSAIVLVDTSTGETHQVTSGYYSDTAPVFDPDGKYLYYLSNRELAPIYSDIDATWIYPNTTHVVAVPLRTDVASPLKPRNDEEGVDEDDEKESKKDDDKKDSAKKDDDKKEKQPEAVKIDLDRFEERAVILPPEAGNYRGLRAVAGKVVYLRLPRSGSASKSNSVVYYDLEEREEKTVLADADVYELSADGKKLLVSTKKTWAIIDLKPDQKLGGPDSKVTKLATDRLEMMLDPRAEWRQMFTDVWRAYRDYFYDPNMHGLDWNALKIHYGELLADAVTRWDVNFAIGELIGEVNASHTYIGGGDTETPQARRVGLLGVDWAIENGFYRIDRIVRGAPWDAEARSPLAEPGVDVNEGDFVLAVNGIPLDTSKAPYASFAGLAEETVQLTVDDRPTEEGARQVLVKTLADESLLRNRAWIESNRQRVEKASKGRIGYIYVPDTGINGQTELVRQFNSQTRKDGLIIDERFNSGGQIPDRFVEKLNRQMVHHIVFRTGDIFTWPPVANYGPKAMLINGWSGSGGDAFPYIFKEVKVGPLIGERTWGGLIGPAVRHGLIDGGSYTAPPGRFYSVRGDWFQEGHGVDPDIPVVDDPGAMAKGGDPQLETAIENVLRRIEQSPSPFVEPPPFEKRVPGGS